MQNLPKQSIKSRVTVIAWANPIYWSKDAMYLRCLPLSSRALCFLEDLLEKADFRPNLLLCSLLLLEFDCCCCIFDFCPALALLFSFSFPLPVLKLDLEMFPEFALVEDERSGLDDRMPCRGRFLNGGLAASVVPPSASKSITNVSLPDFLTTSLKKRPPAWTPVPVLVFREARLDFRDLTPMTLLLSGSVSLSSYSSLKSSSVNESGPWWASTFGSAMTLSWFCPPWLAEAHCPIAHPLQFLSR